MDADLSTKADNYLLGVVHITSLAVGSTDIHQAFAALPQIPPGSYNVGVIIDSAGLNYPSNGVIVESNEADNTAIDSSALLVAPGITGTIRSDRNGNGQFETSGSANDDLPLSGWTVFIDTGSSPNGHLDWTDLNHNGRWDYGEGERWTTTDASGRYYFTDDQVAAGVYDLNPATYRVVAIIPPAWTQTYPNSDNNLATQDPQIVSFPGAASPIVSADFLARPNVDLKDAGPVYSNFTPGNVESPGGSFAVWCDVLNSGIGDAGPFTVSFYASVDNSLATTGDNYFLGSTPVAGVVGNGSMDVTLSLVSMPAIPAGTYHVGFVIDSGNTVIESDETNNTAMISAGSLVVSNLPDLVSGPDSTGDFSSTVVHHGDQWQSSWTVMNRGLVDSSAFGAFVVNFYVSTTDNITQTDQLLWSTSISNVPAGQSVKIQLPMFCFPDLAPGTYYIGMMIDPYNSVQETDETNNLAVSPVTVTVPGITGNVFQDLSGSGLPDITDPGLPGWRILLYRDATGNGVLDAQDNLLKTVVAGPDGKYSFGSVPPGHYIIVENARAGQIRGSSGRGGLAGNRSRRGRGGGDGGRQRAGSRPELCKRSAQSGAR